MSTQLLEIAELEQLGRQELAQEWRKLSHTPVPNVSAGLLRMALIWELQAKEDGGLKPRTQRRLIAFSDSCRSSTELRPGTRLVREWQGKPEIVMIGDAGEIIWNGQEWRSLSEVARAITGTRWSGPAFFGLKKKAEIA